MTYLTMKWFNKTTPPVDYLCFTAEADWTKIYFTKTAWRSSATLEKSTDRETWEDRSGSAVTLNTWDKMYVRNKSETPTNFNQGTSYYAYFRITAWSASASWDVTTLLCKNWTDTIKWNYCFYNLFNSCTRLTSAPSLPATTLTNYCYQEMFNWCTNLTTLPKLPATTLKTQCYSKMFYNCSKIKLSTTQTGEYQTQYRIPITWTWTDSSGNACAYMFTWTGWTFASAPSKNTTYYTSNTLV